MISKKQKKIINEILNDAFWLGFFLEIKRNITDYNQKEILSSFLIFYSSIFCEETIKSNYGGLSGKRNVTLKDIEDFRNYNLKYCPSSKSANATTVIKEMEISFDEFVFDTVLTLSNNELLDINFRSWDLNKKENFELLDGIVATPIRWIEILMPDIYSDIENIFAELSQKYIKKISNYNINKKSYSTYKIFKNSKLNKDEKLYILQRYGLIKCVFCINNIIDDNISIDIGSWHFDLKLFMTKCNAILIELFWNDFKSNKTLNILETISIKNKRLIPDEFYSINRKCKNNLHYSDYHNLSKKDLEILFTFQKKYLNNVLNTFNDNITLKFGLLYRLELFLAKLEYWSRT